MGDYTEKLKTDGGGLPVPQNYNSNPASKGFVIRDIHEPAVEDPNADAGEIPLQKGLLKGIGKQADAAVTNPASSGSLIAFVKGLLKQLQGAGTGAAPVSSADGGQVTIGAKADAAATDSTSAWSVVGLLKGLLKTFLDGTAGFVLKGSNVTDGKTLGVGDVGGANMLYNGATWDRQRGNIEGVLLASAARTATVFSPTQVNHNAKGVNLYLNVIANPGGAETLTIRFYWRDGTAGVNSVYVASFAIPAAANGLFILQLFPGATAMLDNPTKNKALSLGVPRSWMAGVEHSAGGSWTYQLDYGYIL